MMPPPSNAHYTRQAMQIYQDPESLDHAPMPTMQSTNGVKEPSPLRIIKNAASVKRNIIFNLPSSAPNKPSPLKSSQQDSSAPVLTHFNGNSLNKSNINLMPPPPHGATPYYDQTDSLQKKGYGQSHYQVQQPKPLFNALHFPGKENYHPDMYPHHAYNENVHVGNFSLDHIYNYQTPQKRTLMTSPSIQESGRPHKRSKLDSEPILPSPITENFPPLSDDGNKPGHSYATLIGMAILRAPNRRLTLAQIYKWISDTYSFYGASDAGWQNSIRHNLSLNKAFVKQERPKDDPGKGNYWIIEPGMEAQFFKDKSSKKSGSSSDQVNPVTSTPATTQKMDNSRSSYKPLMTASKPELTLSPSPFPAMQKNDTVSQGPDSDATIAASDSPDAEHELENPPATQPPQSSPPGVMHSSPPVLRRNLSQTGCDDTPPSFARFSASSTTRAHKRGLTSMDDSGYFSSLNSSVLRGNGENRSVEVEKAKRTVKRGRAEEAIARLRGSSYDSPTKSRAFGAQTATNHVPPSSSPLRTTVKTDNHQMLPPLTPAVKLRAPTLVPASVSPYTNLQMHRDRVRQLVGSPDRAASVDDSVLWTPQFRLPDEYPTNYEEGFDVFADLGLSPFPGNGSPARRSRRPGLERAQTMNVLSEITSSERNNNTKVESITTLPPPTLKLDVIPKLAPSAFDDHEKFSDFDSPVKGAGNINASTFDLPHDDFLNTEFLEDVTEFDGVDISKGFQRIGAGGGRPKLGGGRPGLGRSVTSIF